ADRVEVVCRVEAPTRRAVALLGDVDEVRAPLADGRDAVGVELEPSRREAGLGEGDRERQAGVAEADDADPQIAAGHPLDEVPGRFGVRRAPLGSVIDDGHVPPWTGQSEFHMASSSWPSRQTANPRP